MTTNHPALEVVKVFSADGERKKKGSPEELPKWKTVLNKLRDLRDFMNGVGK